MRKEKYLIDLSKHPDLRENITAKIYSNMDNFKIVSREKFFSEMKSLYLDKDLLKKNTDSSSQITGQKKNEKNHDLRIKKIKIKSVRGIPDSEIPYSLNLCNERGEPTSHVILGANGSGKSSVFSAVEYVFTSEIGEAQLRLANDNPDEKFYQDYLRSYNKGFGQCFIEIQTNDRMLKLQNEERSGLDDIGITAASLNFISQSDIVKNGKFNYLDGTGNSFSASLLSRFGYGELVELLFSLKSFVDYRPRTLSQKIKDLEHLIKETSQRKELIDEDLLQLKSGKFDLKKNDFQSDYKNKLSEIINAIEKSHRFKKIDILKRRRFSELYASNLQVEGTHQSVVSFYATGISLLDKTRDCPFCENSLFSRNEIAENVKRKISDYDRHNKHYQDLLKVAGDIIDVLKEFRRGIDSLRSAVLRLIEWSIGNDSSKQPSDRFVSFLGSLNNLENEDIVGLIDTMIGAREADVFDDLNQFLGEKYFRFERFQKTLEIEIASLINFVKESFLLQEQARAVDYEEIIKRRYLVSRENELQNDKDRLVKEKLLFERQLLEARENEYSQEEVRKDVAQFVAILEKRLNLELKDIMAPLKSSVESTLNYFLDDAMPGAKVFVDVDGIEDSASNKKNEVVKIRAEMNGESISVSRLFNTFSFNLFCILVDIGLVLALRKSNKVNMPVVIDDVFHSVDYLNKAKIHGLLARTIELFANDEFVDEVGQGQPVQFIIFTHDQTIFDSLYQISAGKSFEVEFAKLYGPKVVVDEDGSRSLLVKTSQFLRSSKFKTALPLEKMEQHK